jgi:hypothetical protein
VKLIDRMLNFSKIQFTIFVLIFSALVSCGESELKIPEGIIPRDSMIMLMSDIHLAEARLLIGGGGVDMKNKYLQNVLYRHGTDTARFNRSFNFYSDHPEYFTKMYDEVIVEISRRQAEKK